jgi:hypothetical protein
LNLGGGASGAPSFGYAKKVTQPLRERAHVREQRMVQAGW